MALAGCRHPACDAGPRAGADRARPRSDRAALRGVASAHGARADRAPLDVSPHSCIPGRGRSHAACLPGGRPCAPRAGVAAVGPGAGRSRSARRVRRPGASDARVQSTDRRGARSLTASAARLIGAEDFVPDSEWRAALVDILPAMVAGMPFAALCGALAVAKGLSPAEVLAMSLFVFAGGAQFAAIEIWSYPVPVFAVVVSTLLINSRHVLMGTSLRPKLHALSAPQRVLGCFLLADENWGVAERGASVSPGCAT